MKCKIIFTSDYIINEWQAWKVGEMEDALYDEQKGQAWVLNPFPGQDRPDLLSISSKYFSIVNEMHELMTQRLLDEKDARIRDLKETLRPFLTSRMQIVGNEIKIL